MRTIVSFALSAVVAVFMLASGLAVGGPIVHAADCENGAIGVDTPNVPYIPAPSINVPNVGCTWVNGYTRKSGVHVNGYWRC
jgi:hypothetical protein